jgi:hypothetical protein
LKHRRSFVSQDRNRPFKQDRDDILESRRYDYQQI